MRVNKILVSSMILASALWEASYTTGTAGAPQSKAPLDVVAAEKTITVNQCDDCHAADLEGVANNGPNLHHNGVMKLYTATTFSRLLHQGLDSGGRPVNSDMPIFKAISASESNNLFRYLMMKPIPSQVDLVVTKAGWKPEHPRVGDPVTFYATIKNQGTQPTPPGTVVGVAFLVDGESMTWSDDNSISLAPGASRTQSANNGKNKKAEWPLSKGSHTVTAWVDDINRIPESDGGNNQLSATLTPF